MSYPDAVDDADQLFMRHLPHVERDLVVADNSLPEDHEEVLQPGRILVGSSNSYWEFSAWDRAIAYLGRRLDNYDLVHLATSAFRTSYIRYLDCFDQGMLSLILCRAAAVGHIDYFNEPVILQGRCTQAWLRSSWVFLPPRELRLLGSLVSIGDPAPFFTGDPAAPFRRDAPLSANYQRYILGWLTGDGTGQGVEWHSRFALSADTLPTFEAKTLAILNEQMLGIRLRVQGCAMVDATWLATQSAAMKFGRPLGAIPGWRWQITGRAVDAAPISLIRSPYPSGG